MVPRKTRLPARRAWATRFGAGRPLHARRACRDEGGLGIISTAGRAAALIREENGRVEKCPHLPAEDRRMPGEGFKPRRSRPDIDGDAAKRKDILRACGPPRDHAMKYV